MEMMHDITHFDGILAQRDWLMVLTLSAESKETNWEHNQTKTGLLPSATEPSFLSHVALFRLPLHPAADLSSLSYNSSAVAD